MKTKPANPHWQRVYGSRLLALSTRLRKLPKKRFDLSTWVGTNWKGAQDLSCGTAGCAMGWAATMPKFRALGLDLSPSGNPRLGIYYGLRAAAVLFSITEAEASLLFVSNAATKQVTHYGRYSLQRNKHTATPLMVAKLIERFVAAKAHRFEGIEELVKPLYPFS